MSVDQALRKAKSHIKNDEIAKAHKMYQDVLISFPKNIRAKQGLALLNKRIKINKIKKLSQEDIDQLVSLYDRGQFSVVIEKAKALL